jgi:hypothetical protein
MWAKALLFVLAMQPVPTIPWLPSPTPIPTWTPQPTPVSEFEASDLYRNLQTAVANVNALPNDASAPGGVPLLPGDSSANIFSYAKWMLSGVGASELLGKQLYPLATHLMIAVTLVIVLATVFFIVNLVVLIVRFIVWLVMRVLKFVPFIGAFAFMQPPATPTFMPMAPQAPITIPDVKIWDFADDTVAQWNQLGADRTGVFQIALVVMLIMSGFLFIKRLVSSLQKMGDGDGEG